MRIFSTIFFALVLCLAAPAFADIAPNGVTNGSTNNDTTSTNNDTNSTNNGTSADNNGTSGDTSGSTDGGDDSNSDDDAGCSVAGFQAVGTFAPMVIGLGLLVGLRRRRED